MKTPIIGITCNTLDLIPQTLDEGIAAPGQDWQLIASDYVRIVKKAGAVAVLLPITTDIEKAKVLWRSLDGILISGGNDVDPTLYKERISGKCGAIDTCRDTYEIAALNFALANDIPVLGICRGIQVFNVAIGGTLYQDLPSAGFESHTILAKKRNEGTHTITLNESGWLYDVLKEKDISVNSFHHQAVKDLGKGATVLAKSDDGLIEAISIDNSKFAVAVQWHPEMMFDSEQQLDLIKAFVKECQ